MSSEQDNSKKLIGLLIVVVLVMAYLNREAIKKWWDSVYKVDVNNPVLVSQPPVNQGQNPVLVSQPPVNQGQNPVLVSQPPINKGQDSIQSLPAYAYMGCYVDKTERDLPIYGGDMTLDECANKARSLKYNIFGLQFSEGSGFGGKGGQCWYGNDTNYGMHGTSNTCTVLDGRGFGSAYSNAIYALNNER
jgi:hypothetical protein